MSQTYSDWECILIDDGSTDRSSSICEEYTNKDCRFRFYKKKNGGVSSARNLGLDKVEGDWVYFSDADDTVEPNALETLLNGTVNGSHLVMAGFQKYAENGGLREMCKEEKTKEINVEEAIIEQYNPSDFSYQGYLWSKLFKTDVIKNNRLKFDESISFNEDGLFIMQYICCMTGTVYYTTKSVYNYIERSSSAMGSIHNHFNPKFATHLDSVLKQKEVVFAYTDNKYIRMLAMKRIAMLYLYCEDMMREHGEYDSSLHKEIYGKLKKSGAMSQLYKAKLIRLSYPFRRLIKRVLVKNCPSILKMVGKSV